MTRVAVGCDHAGVAARTAIIKLLRDEGCEVLDVGADNDESVDYPDFASRVAAAVSRGECDRGILICGTGIGMSMAANKFPGVRAAVCHDEFTTRLSRRHNNANVLCMGARVLDTEEMVKLAGVFMHTDAETGRHQRRVEKITRIEKELGCGSSTSGHDAG